MRNSAGIADLLKTNRSPGLVSCAFALALFACAHDYEHLQSGVRQDSGSAGVGDQDGGLDSRVDSGRWTDGDDDGALERGAPLSCEGLVCREQPDNQCSALADIEVFEPVGYCVAGRCEYVSHHEPCESGACADGICVDCPCQGLYCDTPPAKQCVDQNTLRMYEPVGFCSTGSCKYVYKDYDCSQAGWCEQGQCVEDLCIGMVCDWPPARYCVDGAKLRVYEAFGVCGTQGECAYDYQDVACGSSCESGKCQKDPCAGVVCNVQPVSRCVSGTHLRAYEGSGICEQGACRYGWEDIECEQGCADGQCVDEPCAGVVCDTPPASRCLNNGKLAVYASTGSCQMGVCTYFQSEVQCSGGCEAGRCRGDPCEGVICNVPPAAHCVDRERIWYDAVGSCEAGGCVYEQRVESCDHGCLNAACLPLSCEPGLTDCGGCVNTLSDAANCGSCGKVCGPYANATASCSGGQCAMSCNSGRADCNGGLSNGCETQLGTASNCERCGDDCLALPHVDAAACQSGSCVITACDTDYADCDGQPSTGCEHDLGVGPCEETDCDDGNDDDGDGLTDCVDQDCDGLSGCEYGIELSCDDLMDNDGDADTDCDDADCVSDLACVGTSCDLSGYWAMRQDLYIAWDSNLMIENDELSTTAWELHRYQYDGSRIEVQKKPCGQDDYPDYHSTISETYSSYVPLSTFDQLPLKDGVDIALADAQPGSDFISPSEASLMGIDLADPLTDPWPSSGDEPGIMWTDDDGDGMPGVSWWPRWTTEPTDNPGDGSATYDYYPAEIELPLGVIARAGCVSRARRDISHLEGEVETCSRITGSVINESSEFRVYGCTVVPEGEWDTAEVTCTATDWASGTQCNPEQVESLDSEDMNNNQTSSATFALVKIGLLTDFVDCQMVRSALPP